MTRRRWEVAARAVVAGAVTMAAIAAGTAGGASASAGGSRASAEATHASGWGDDSVGQIGDGGAETVRRTPVAVAYEGLRITRVSAGGDHSLGVAGNGALFAWGGNHYGQLGDGTTQDRRTPTMVPGLSDVKDVAAGNGFSLALRADGTVWSWGVNDSGQLGVGTFGEPERTPRRVPTLTDVVDVVAGNGHALALRGDGTLWAWGNNHEGRLGDGSTTNRATPVKVLTKVRAAAAGYAHSVAVRANGTVLAWGDNGSGQLGDGTTTNRTEPEQLNDLENVTDVGAGDFHSMAIGAGNALYAWGDNGDGQLGDGTTTGRLTPVPVTGMTGVAKVTGGSAYTAALRADGTVWTWGRNDRGQLGDGTTTERLTPAQVPGLTGVTDIDAGFHRRFHHRYSHTLVVRPTTAPAFSIGLAADAVTLPAGGTATVTVTSESYATPPQTLRLSAGTAPNGVAKAKQPSDGLPPGISASFSPASVTAGGTSTLTLTAAPDVHPHGESVPVVVTALGDPGTATATFQLQITPASESE